MENVITYENLRNFAYSNDDLIQGPIRGVILEFMGLNGSAMYDAHTERGIDLAARGIVLMIPYNNPWNWMNRQAVDFTDALLEALRAHYDLKADPPIVSTGGSMGGLCALVYARTARVTPIACVVNCPVCDLPFHYTERPDLPRTLLSAYQTEPYATLDEALKAHSPLHLAAELPDISYSLFHCLEDRMVDIRAHSERFVAAMRACGKHIQYFKVPGRDHCDLDEEARARYHHLAVESIERARGVKSNG